jgi:hypothetical protein
VHESGDLVRTLAASGDLCEMILSVCPCRAAVEPSEKTFFRHEAFWVAGVFVTSLGVMIGRFRVSVLHGKGDGRTAKTYSDQLFQLSKKLGIRRRVGLMTGST